MKNQSLRLFVLFAAVLPAASCMTPYPPKDADIQKRAGFLSAYFNLISYAKSQMKVDFSADSCSECGVRVIDARDVPKFVDIYRTGFEGEKLEAVQRTIATSRGRAVVLTNVPDVRTRKTVNLVFLPMGQEQFVSCPEATNAVFLMNVPQAAFPCGLRSFGQKPGGPLCAYCAIGICCGACKCNPCVTFTIGRSGLDLPERFDRLFDSPHTLEEFPVNVDLVKRHSL